MTNRAHEDAEKAWQAWADNQGDALIDLPSQQIVLSAFFDAFAAGRASLSPDANAADEPTVIMPPNRTYPVKVHLKHKGRGEPFVSTDELNQDDAAAAPVTRVDEGERAKMLRVAKIVLEAAANQADGWWALPVDVMTFDVASGLATCNGTPIAQTIRAIDVLALLSAPAAAPQIDREAMQIVKKALLMCQDLIRSTHSHDSIYREPIDAALAALARAVTPAAGRNEREANQ